MNGRDDDAVRVAELVAGLHGEGGRAPRADDEAELDAVATLRDLDDVLTILGAEARESWHDHDSSTDPLPGGGAVRAATVNRLPGWLALVAAAAVLAGVFVIARLEPALDALVVGRGEDLLVRCTPLHAGHGPLHAELGFHLVIEARDGRRVAMLPRDPADGPSLGDRLGFATLVGGTDEWLVQIDAVVRDPAGRELRGFVVLRDVPESGLRGAPLEIDVHLHELWVADPAPTPYVSVFEAEDGSAEVDFRRGFARYGLSAVGGYRPFLPQEPGRHEVEFTVRGAWGKSAAAAVNPDANPTSVRHAFVVDGEATDWSEAVDGLRVRLIAPVGALDPAADWPLALQIENVGDLSLDYNVLGSTAAPIPQPFHLRLWVDGGEVGQRERQPVVLPALWFPEHPAGTRLTMSVSPRAVWRMDELAVDAGRHRFSLELDTRPLLAGPDPSIWKGRVRCPDASIRLR